MGTLVIYDEEEDYARTLLEYIDEKKGLPFKTFAFNKMEEFIKFTKSTVVNMLISSKPIQNDNVKKVLYLNEGNSISEATEEVKSIYKYQSAEKIFKEIMEQYALTAGDFSGSGRNNNHVARIVGVYSPVGRSGKTSFAITLGQILQNQGPTLYLNLEEFSGFAGIFNKDYSGDLADLMYYYKQEPGFIGLKLKTIASDLHGMDYVPPMVYSGNIRNIESEMWINLIKDIARLGMYDNIIVDLSNMVSDIPAVLDVCDTIYTPLDNNRISMCKINEYEEYLLKTGRENIVSKTVKIKLPGGEHKDWDEHYIEELVWGELGDFIKKIISEEAA